MPKIGVLFNAKLYSFLCKIGVEFFENVLEMARKRGSFLTWGTYVRYTFKYEATTPGYYVMFLFILRPNRGSPSKWRYSAKSE